MSVAALLLLYSLAVTVLGPPLLRRVTHTGLAPRFGVLAWLTAIGSVLLSWAAATAFFVIDVAHGHHHGFLVASCLARLRGIVTGNAGTVAQIASAALAGAAAAALALVTVRLVRTLSRLRARTHEHARAVRLVGHRTAAEDVVILDAAKPAAYCVHGHPPAIVITTGALAALDDRQMHAVLAHERAHLAGHHPHIAVVLRTVATVFPKLTLMTDGATEVSRLLEMRADDAAARRHGRGPLLSGLITLAGAVPASALAAGDVAVLARAERLSEPQAHLARARAHALLVSAMTLLATGPLLTAALATSGVLMC